MQALLIGDSVELMLALPEMLKQSGFDVDCVSTRHKFKSIPSLRQFFPVRSLAHLPALAADLASNRYDLVVVADDVCLHAILKSSLSEKDKLALLPVASLSDFSHFCSKIGLSQLFQLHAIPTPEFLVIPDSQALQQANEKMTFPLILKGEFSGGGRQTFECADQSDLVILVKNFDAYPAILQKKIIGKEIGVEAFYQQGKLIHFSYARVLKTDKNRQFAPSKLREYTQTGTLDPAVFDELQRMGVALGADGFVNITMLISQADGKRYYIEADMRPTTWIVFPKYFGDAPAQKIKNYFASGHLPDRAGQRNPAYQEKIIFPYFLRLELWELMCNRHQVWQYMRWDGLHLYALLRKMKHTLLALLNMRTLRREFKKHF